MQTPINVPTGTIVALRIFLSPKTGIVVLLFPWCFRVSMVTVAGVSQVTVTGVSMVTVTVVGIDEDLLGTDARVEV